MILQHASGLGFPSFGSSVRSSVRSSLGSNVNSRFTGIRNSFKKGIAGIGQNLKQASTQALQQTRALQQAPPQTQIPQQVPQQTSMPTPPQTSMPTQEPSTINQQNMKVNNNGWYIKHANIDFVKPEPLLKENILKYSDIDSDLINQILKDEDMIDEDNNLNQFDPTRYSIDNLYNMLMKIMNLYEIIKYYEKYLMQKNAKNEKNAEKKSCGTKAFNYISKSIVTNTKSNIQNMINKHIEYVLKKITTTYTITLIYLVLIMKINANELKKDMQIGKDLIIKEGSKNIYKNGKKIIFNKNNYSTTFIIIIKQNNYLFNLDELNIKKIKPRINGNNTVYDILDDMDLDIYRINQFEKNISLITIIKYLQIKTLITGAPKIEYASYIDRYNINNKGIFNILYAYSKYMATIYYTMIYNINYTIYKYKSIKNEYNRNIKIQKQKLNENRKKTNKNLAQSIFTAVKRQNPETQLNVGYRREKEIEYYGL